VAFVDTITRPGVGECRALHDGLEEIIRRSLAVSAKAHHSHVCGSRVTPKRRDPVRATAWHRHRRLRREGAFVELPLQ